MSIIVFRRKVHTVSFLQDLFTCLIYNKANFVGEAKALVADGD